MSSTFTNLAFYAFIPIDAPASAVDEVEQLAQARNLLGTVLIAHEGLNAMLCGAPADCDGFEHDLKEWRSEFKDVQFKRSYSDRLVFERLKVKAKPEIVTLRAGEVSWDNTAPHLPPETFRDWIRAGEDMVLIDTRNDFEFKLGTFKGSQNPETTAFHEFPEFVANNRATWRDKKIVMFCTGGIRCEKATSWMNQEGIGNVYQLEGGVLNYFERIDDAEKDWEGELFVFDDRVAIDTELNETSTTIESIEQGSEK